MAMGDSGEGTSDGVEGEDFLVHGWNAAKIRVNENRSGF